MDNTIELLKIKANAQLVGKSGFANKYNKQSKQLKTKALTSDME